MFKTVRNAWAIPELRKKILFTIFALLIFRLGSSVPVPWIDTKGLQDYLNAMSGSIFGLINAMSGNAFSMATVFALGVQPYINSSIIIQLLTVAIPALEQMQKEGGEEGRKKIAAITRYTTVAIALLQGFGYFTLINANGLVSGDLPTWLAGIIIVLSFTAGSAFVMWLGEQITEFGIGNGISVILFAGIVSRFPSMLMNMVQGVQKWSMHLTDSEISAMGTTQGEAFRNSLVHPAMIPLIVIGILALVVFIVFINDSERRIPVQYAKRVVGRKMYGGQSSHIPLKVNMSGVMPIIFAQAIASLPATIAAFIPGGSESTFMKVFDSNGLVYAIVYFLLILGFSYFYATMQFNPIEVANNLKKNGGFVPGFRPGKPTADFIHKVLNKITLFGAIYLAIIALLPIITSNIINLVSGSQMGRSLSIGGTSIIIVVGVALETVKALEAQMLMRHYKGFLE
ncbi:preprotein translocase subunit SecY [uncultured Pseudoflavonifractor sp.]|uniref:preprotein translocase subunit SecY n=1 Tax=uncultured Pseudoflavonifractor sp. TaxID=1221379 RepID=UPI0025EBEDF9|nr:preprotein translocase subunit SecY [uncultured Pseudoflavonifractor sp.]